MGYNAAPLERLIEQFAKLPGIGRKGHAPGVSGAEHG
jgi:recombinational DNA repair protein RecR